VRARCITFGGFLILALPFAAHAALTQHAKASMAPNGLVPFTTVSAGASTRHPRRNRVFLARSLAATRAWSGWLTPHARKALHAVNFARYGVVVVFRLRKSTGVRITRIARASRTFGLWLAVPRPPPPNPTRATLGAYHLVALERRFLRGVSRLVVRAVIVE
jgi:hypothetical protein